MTDVTFVTHEATLTGAPVGLVQLLDWLRAHTALDVAVVVLEDGPLTARLEAVARVQSVDELVSGPEPGVLFLNSTFSGRVLLHSSFGASHVLCRVPELGFALDAVLPHDVLAAVLTRADRFLAVSGAVKAHLVHDRGIADDRVAIIHGAIPTGSAGVEPERVAQARAELDVAPGQPLIGSVGAIHWRKGPDLFVQLAAVLHRRVPDADLRFVWLGGEAESEPFRRVRREADRCGLGHRLRVLPSRHEPAPIEATLDVFVSTSREDPFPRVCLEAAALGTPIVAFASGGVEDLLTDHPDLVVAYEDVEAMADRVLGLLDDQDRAARVSDDLRRQVRTRFDLEVSARATLEEIERGLRG